MALKKTGDWGKIGRLIANIGDVMEESRNEALSAWALKAEALAKGHMSRQDLGWKALDPKTISAKIRKGQSENILIATSDYFQAITSWHDKEGAYAGVTKEVRNSDGDVIADIAALHEYGSESGKLPARPLWQPVYAEAMKWFSTSDKRPNKIFEKKIKKYM